MLHRVEKTADGYTCTVCQWAWKSRPRSSCPGVVRYPCQGAPEHLKTSNQLNKMRLHAGPIRGIVGFWWLHDVNETRPWTAEEIAADRKRKARLRRCQFCGKDVYKNKWDDEYHACNKCLPRAIAERDEEEREDERRFQEMLVRDRDKQIRWARSLLERTDWVVIDTETTGLESIIGEVVSVAIMDPNGRVLLDTLIKPSKSIPDHITEINGLTDAIVADAPSFMEVFPQICNLLANRFVVAYNAGFDKSMLQGNCVRCKLSQDILPPWEKWIDVMEPFAAYCGSWHEYYGNYTWQSLPKGNHQAAGDCLAVLELIRDMAASRLSTEDISEEPQKENQYANP